MGKHYKGLVHYSYCSPRQTCSVCFSCVWSGFPCPIAMHVLDPIFHTTYWTFFFYLLSLLRCFFLLYDKKIDRNFKEGKKICLHYIIPVARGQDEWKDLWCLLFHADLWKYFIPLYDFKSQRPWSTCIDLAIHNLEMFIVSTRHASWETL